MVFWAYLREMGDYVTMNEIDRREVVELSIMNDRR
jgi:hypothetical protein